MIAWCVFLTHKNYGCVGAARWLALAMTIDLDQTPTNTPIHDVLHLSPYALPTSFGEKFKKGTMHRAPTQPMVHVSLLRSFSPAKSNSEAQFLMAKSF